MPRILLVDDEKAVKWALQQALVDEDYEVETANSGEEGLLKARQKTFDLVISDLRMPGMSGLDMIRELKKDQPSLKTIICSAYGSMESVVGAMRMGVNDFMVKPFKMAAMKEAIAKILSAPAETVNLSIDMDQLEPKVATRPVAPVSQAPSVAAAPDLLVHPSLPYALAGTAGSLSEGVFLDIAEEGGKHLVLLGESPVVGPAAHALSHLVRGIFRHQIRHAIEPGEAVRAINETLWKSFHPRPPISLFYGLLDPEKEELRYVCSGDRVLAGIRRGEGSDEPLKSEGASLGLFPGVLTVERNVKMKSGDRLVLLASARSELLSPLPGVQESFMTRVMPQVNWQDSGQLARQIQGAAGALNASQPATDLTVIVLETAPSRAAEARREVRMSSAEQNLHLLLTELGCLGQQNQISTDLMHDITTAVVEAVNNAQTHAYAQEGPIMVRMALSNGELVVEVCDQGTGFDFKSYRPPDLQGYDGLTSDHGRGIYLIQQLMDRTLIESRPGQGTIIHMAKSLGKNLS